MCFGEAAFDTYTLQHVIYIRSRLNRFRVMIDFVRDFNKFQIL